MPHATIEYSANLEQRLDIAALCTATLEAASSTGALELAATRVRAVRCDHYAIADRHCDNAFVDVSLRIGRGRSEEAKAAAGKALWEALRAQCAPLFETPYFALSLELREIDPVLSWKENGIKPRLRAAR
jgi:5-carboxymethyl-2-hydroxymuconate isomerase